LTPYLRQVLTGGLGAFLVEAVHVPAAHLLVSHEAGMVQQAQMSRDSGAADGEPVGDFLNGARFAHQELDDGSSVGIAERVKRVILTIVLTSLAHGSLHLEYGNGWVTVTELLPR
jgi:hypothetical protein